MKKIIQSFLFPKINKRFISRLIIIATITVIICKYFLQPVVIDGKSMLPTYKERGINFCLLNRFIPYTPKRGDVVVLKYGGDKYMLLKRIIAFEGETVEFKDGKCFVNGVQLEEHYVKYPCSWNTQPLVVGENEIYVIGDNRSTTFHQHVGGAISINRVKGVPIW